MGIPQTVREADTEAREAILKAIKEQASTPLSTQNLLHLAQAYNFVASTEAAREPAKMRQSQGF